MAYKKKKNPHFKTGPPKNTTLATPLACPQHRPCGYLLVQELPGVLLDVALVQVGGQAHEPHLGQAEVCQLDVAHGRDQKTGGTETDSAFRRVPWKTVHCTMLRPSLQTTTRLCEML